MLPTHALTIWQPWAALIAAADPSLAQVHFKTVESRPWRPRHERIGERIAIHAGLTRDAAIEQWLRNLGVTIAWNPRIVAAWNSTGAVVAVATIVDVRRNVRTPECARQCFSAGLSDEAAERAARSVPDELGWVLADVECLRRPVKWRGDRGLWKVPAELASAIEEHLPILHGGSATSGGVR